MFKKFGSTKGWDNEKPSYEYFIELFRVSKNQIIWGGNYFIENLKNTKCIIWWDKMNGTNMMADGEMAWTSFDKHSKRFQMHHFSKGYDDKIHPCQKPTKLYEWCYKNFTEEGQKIIDTHLGSGSSRIAAHKNKLNFVGFEIDKEYFDKQEKRFADYVSQLTLF
jgi:site-specific DNA-methyltransferase (adenine-specific)